MKNARASPPGQSLYWDRLRKELKVVALQVCRDASVPLWEDADDFAQDAFMVAINFVESRVPGRVVTPELHEQWREEALRYAKTALYNNFRDRVRQIRGHSDAFQLEELVFAAAYCWGGNRSTATPEDHAIAHDLVRRIAIAAETTRSSVYQRLAEALQVALDRGTASLDSKGLIQLAVVTANQRRDFARMLTARLGLSPTHIVERNDG